MRTVFVALMALVLFCGADYAKRYPTDTALEVYTPNNPPPGTGTETNPQDCFYFTSDSYFCITDSQVDLYIDDTILHSWMNVPVASNFLLESGDALLLEDGLSNFLLE